MTRWLMPFIWTALASSTVAFTDPQPEASPRESPTDIDSKLTGSAKSESSRPLGGSLLPRVPGVFLSYRKNIRSGPARSANPPTARLWRAVSRGVVGCLASRLLFSEAGEPLTAYARARVLVAQELHPNITELRRRCWSP
jgi:hypothetical protein